MSLIGLYRIYLRLIGRRFHEVGQPINRVVLCEPLGYLDFIGLIGEAKVVLTDSGGIQEEPRCSASRA